MRQTRVILAVLPIIVAAALLYHVHAVQAQSRPLSYPKLIHVKSDTGGNMEDDSERAINGEVKGLSCIAPNDCWVAVQ